MAKKVTITKDEMVAKYMNAILEGNTKPTSVYAFAKENHFEEAKFYEFFGSFETLEQYIFDAFFEQSIIALQNSDEYKTFDSRNKLLSFYFTFFENLTANRSYVLYILKDHKQHLNSFKLLNRSKKIFTQFIQSLNIEILDLNNDKIQRFQNKTIEQSAWIQLLLTIKFWIDDTSANFEKTDIFIEKSVNTSFDVLNLVPIKSVIDLGKFIFKEKMHMN